MVRGPDIVRIRYAVAVLTVVLSLACDVNEEAPQYDLWGSPPSVWTPRGGHYGPAWGYADGEGLIVFRWEEGRGPYGGSLYTIREDGTNLTLLSASIGDGRTLGETQIAYDTSPAISPDGSRVVYATLRHSQRAQSFDIVTASLDGTERQQLTGDEGSEGEPAWSPDGMRIAFLHNNNLRTMAADGSDVRSIAPDTWSSHEPPAWSPEGARLAFRDATYEMELHIVGADGSNLTRVAHGPAPVVREWSWERPAGGPAWSPDGRRIAFVRPTDDGFKALEVLEVDTGSASTTVASGRIGPILWSRDGTEVYFGSYYLQFAQDVLSERGVFTVAVEGEHRTRRVTPESAVRGVAWSPDGERLAVLTDRARAIDGDVAAVLYTVARDGSDLRVLAREGPDGALLAAGEMAR